jgi:pimeloyl-ACP methyl ester carboxylesterase
MMEEGKKRKARGEQMMVPRWDIVPIPEHLRGNLSKGSFFEFPFDVVESMYNFMANDVVGKIAPRPLLLLHPSNDSVTPTEQSVDLFMHAGKDSTDLHLVAKTDHFILSEGNDIVLDLVKNWLEKNIPVDPSKVKASNSAHAKE